MKIFFRKHIETMFSGILTLFVVILDRSCDIFNFVQIFFSLKSAKIKKLKVQKTLFSTMLTSFVVILDRTWTIFNFGQFFFHSNQRKLKNEYSMQRDF